MNEVEIQVTAREESPDEYQVTMSDKLINTFTSEYPLNFRQAKFPFLVGFGNTMSLSFLQEYGYDLVYPTERPVSDVVEELTPAKQEDGKYYQVWSARPYNAVELALQLSAAKDIGEIERTIQRDRILMSGVPFNFGDEHGTRNVQMRIDDRVNILGLAHKALRDQNFTATFCTADNTLVPVDAAQITDLSDRVLSAYTAVMGASWELRKMIEEATAPSEVPTAEDMEALLTAALA